MQVARSCIRPNLLTDDQVAEILGIKPHTLAVWRCKGIGPKFIRIGRRVRYPEPGINEFLAAHTVLPGDAA